MAQPVICIDFDGTLVDSQGHIHPRDVNILRSEREVIVIPSTGRPLHAVRTAFTQNSLFVGQPIPLPLLLQNGAVVYKPNETLLAHYPFEPSDQAALVETAWKYSGISFFFFGLDTIKLLWPNEPGLQMARRFALETRPLSGAERFSRTFTKLMCIAKVPDPLHAFADEIRGLNLELSFSLPTVLEINRSGVNKGLTMVTLLDELGLTGAPIAAAGDGENDLPLFELADMTFSPSGSVLSIRERADHVIDVAETGILSPILESLAAV